MVCVIDIIDDDVETVPIDERLGVKALTIVIMNFDSNGFNEYDKIVHALHGSCSYNYALIKLYLTLKNRTPPPT